MKKTKKAIKLGTAILTASLGMSLIAPVAQASTFAEHSQFFNMVPDDLGQGYTMNPGKENHPYRPAVVREKNFNIYSRIHESNNSKRWNPCKLPEKIDPRGTYLETPVRHQGTQGLCWAYSGVDILSINEKKQTGYTSIYSPNFFNYSHAGNSFNVGETKDQYNKDMPSSNPTAEWWAGPDGGGYIGLSAGGNAVLLSNDLQVHQTGLVKERNFLTGAWDSERGEVYGFPELANTPMDYHSFLTIKATADQTYDLKNVQAVQPLQEITGDAVAEHTQKIKTLIAQYGAARLSINGMLLDHAVTIDEPQPQIYNNEHNALNIPFGYLAEAHGVVNVTYNGQPGRTMALGTNHQVTIVGYDDNFSADNFNEGVRPASNGAFLVKNSWGKGYHDNGYFWISYESGIMAAYDIIAYQFGPHDAHKLAQNATATAGFDVALSEQAEYQGKAFLAETFDASDVDRFVTNVNATLGGENVSYKLSVIEGDLNIGSANPDPDSPFEYVAPYKNLKQNVLKTVCGSSKFAFEHKLPLNFKFKKGHKYTVLVEETASSLNTILDFPVAANPFITKDQVAGQSYMGVVNGSNIYSVDMHDAAAFGVPNHPNVVAQNNISLDYK
jgi:hypothetical protein